MQIIFNRILLIWLIIINLVGAVGIAKVSRIRVSDARDFGLKMAIYPEQHQSNNQHLWQIIKIIADDLNYTGQFKINCLDPTFNDYQLYKPNIIDNKLIDFDVKFWRNLGLEYLLMAKLEVAADHRKLVFKIQLLDLYKPLDPIILTHATVKYSGEALRAFAHKISDVIFTKLIGTKSFFNTKIAYIGVERLGQQQPEYSLNLADFDGFNEHRLLVANYPLMSPKWSPDGKKIAFVSFKGNRSSVNIIDMERKNSTVISKYPGINGAPAWSPSGDKLALVLSKDGNPGIYILNLATNNLVRLTQGFCIDTEPYWSKDGQEIFFTSNRSGKPQIYKINLFTEKISRVTFYGEYNASPLITVDSKYLVMLHCYENCSKTNAEFNIALQSLETGKVKLLTNAGMEDSLALAPNDSMVIYSTRVNKESNLVLAGVDIDGNGYQYLPIMNRGNVKSPTWSPPLE